MKEVGTQHWVSPNESVTNEFGFAALPDGYQDEDENIMKRGPAGHCWFYDYSGYNSHQYYGLSHISKTVIVWQCDKGTGGSIRCFKNP